MKKYLRKNEKKIVGAVCLLFLAFVFAATFALPTKALAIDLNFTEGIEITPAYQVLAGGDKNAIKGVWQSIMNLVNGIIVVLLIVVAFAQILRININTYGVKKILPTLVLSIIAANFSYLFCRLLVDLANIALDYLINFGGGSPGTLSNALNGSNTWASPDPKSGPNLYPDLATDGATVFWFIIMQFVLFATGVVIYILDFLFFIRLWVIYFLVPLAPLAMISMVLPQTKSLFSQWWTNFSKWVFMPVVSVFWIWLGSRWFETLTQGSWFMGLIFAGVCFYVAITTPFKMGGAIMGQWGKIGKNLWGKTGGFALNQAKKGGLWVVGGGAMSSYQAHALKKAATAGEIGDKKAENKWRRRANAAGYLNPKTYKQGWKERMAAAGAAADKAVLKTSGYGRMAGVARQIQAFNEANRDDDLGAPTSELATKAKGFTSDIMKSTNSKMMAYFNEKKEEAKKSHEVINGEMSEETMARQLILNDIRTTNDAALADLFSGTGFTPKKIGEAKSVANAFFRRKSSREGKHLDAIFASSAVGANGGGLQGALVGGGQAVLEEIIKGGDPKAALKAALSTMPPEQGEALKNSLRSVRNEFDEWTKNEIELRTKEAEESLGIGFETLKNELTHLGGQISKFKSLDDLSAYLDSEAAGTESFGDPIMKKSRQQALDHAKFAVNEMKAQGQGIAFDSPSLDIDSIGKNVTKRVMESVQKQVQAEATVKLGTDMAMARVVQNPAVANADISSPEALQALTDSMEGLKKTMSENKGAGSISQVAALDPSSINAKGIISDAMSKVTSDMGKTVGDALKSKAFRDNIAEGFTRSMRQVKPPTAPPPPAPKS